LDSISDPANHVTSFPRAVTNKNRSAAPRILPQKCMARRLLPMDHPGGGRVESSPIQARAAASFQPPGGGGVPVGHVCPPPPARRRSPTGDGGHRLHMLGEQRSIHDGSRTTQMMSQPRHGSGTGGGSNKPTTTPATATHGDTFPGSRRTQPTPRGF
jgi:hypothetical protein